MIFALSALIIAIYWFSPLAFSPVPWPDDSVFFLAGIDWLHWPSHYRMLSQSPFIPSYALANFNSMPGLPFVYGLGHLIGFNTSFLIKGFNFLCLFLWTLSLGFWVRKRAVDRDLKKGWGTLLSMAALLSPFIRWGATVVRPEMVEGLLFLWILMDLDGYWKKKSDWRIPLLLALSASFHFEAIIWVPAVALAVAPQKLLSIALRTLSLLSPWLLYVMTRPLLFAEQMRVQFGRLAEGKHPYIQSFYGFLQSIFLSEWGPVGIPKSFNTGKILFWFLLIASLVLAIKKIRKKNALFLASALGVVMSFLLWINKPETWFVTLIHLTVWPLLSLAVLEWAKKDTLWRRTTRSAILLLLVFEASASLTQLQALRKDYSWSRFSQWIDCVDQETKNVNKIWQTHWPDVLVGLAGKNPNRIYTRAVDFPHVEDRVAQHAADVDIIIHSEYLRLDDPKISRIYHGVSEPLDENFIRDYPWIPYKQYAGSMKQPPTPMSICQVGPFWAAITRKTLSGGTL